MNELCGLLMLSYWLMCVCVVYCDVGFGWFSMNFRLSLWVVWLKWCGVKLCVIGFGLFVGNLGLFVLSVGSVGCFVFGGGKNIFM